MSLICQSCHLVFVLQLTNQHLAFPTKWSTQYKTIINLLAYDARDLLKLIKKLDSIKIHIVAPMKTKNYTVNVSNYASVTTMKKVLKEFC